MGVAFATDAGLALLTLDDGAGGNRLNPESLQALTAAFAAAEADSTVRAVLLRSAGPAFCLGMDLSRVGGDGAEAAAAIRLYSELLLHIHRSPLPVIALVQGPVKAGGVGLVAACDLVIAVEAADFQLSEVLLGLVPVNVLPFLLARRVSPARARELILTARVCTAAEALALGLVDRVYSAEKLERGLKSELKMLFRAAPSALAQTKAFTAALDGLSLEGQCALAREALLRLSAADDVQHAVAAFRKDELPRWSVAYKPGVPLVVEQP